MMVTGMRLAVVALLVLTALVASETEAASSSNVVKLRLQGSRRLSGGRYSWHTAKAACELKGFKLCPRKAYCPHGRHRTPDGGIRSGDTWAPFSGEGTNRWISIGNYATSYRLCGEHKQLGYGSPWWGKTTRSFGFKKVVYCCKTKSPIRARYEGAKRLQGGRYSWDSAQRTCSQKGLELCPRSVYCPKGLRRAPHGGIRSGDTWAPFSGEGKNRWISIGSYATSYRLCGEHQQLGYGSPWWGKTTRSFHFKKVVYCCKKSPIRLRLQGASRLAGGRYSWGSAKRACEKKGLKLCPRKAYCPKGRHKTPDGGIRIGDTWAPFSGEGKNRWISIGNYATSYRLCGEHKQLGYGSPWWGKSTRSFAFKKVVYCCSKKKKIDTSKTMYNSGWIKGWKMGYNEATLRGTQ